MFQIKRNIKKKISSLLYCFTVAPDPALATDAAAAILFLSECVKALARLFVTKAFSSKTKKIIQAA